MFCFWRGGKKQNNQSDAQGPDFQLQAISCFLAPASPGLLFIIQCENLLDETQGYFCVGSLGSCLFHRQGEKVDSSPKKTAGELNEQHVRRSNVSLVSFPFFLLLLFSPPLPFFFWRKFCICAQRALFVSFRVELKSSPPFIRFFSSSRAISLISDADLILSGQCTHTCTLTHKPVLLLLSAVYFLFSLSLSFPYLS